MKQKKHILRKAILTIAPMTMMVAALLIGFRNNNAVHVEALSGSGTKSNPYLISSENDLLEVMSNVDNGSNSYANKYLSVTNNLSVKLSATTNAKTFRGHLDGGGFTITLSTSTTDGAVAMFNCVGSAGSVSNIVFEGSISGVGSMSSTVCVYNYGLISNVTNNCDIDSINENGIIGGIAASEIATTAKIENCVNNATISGTKYVGGIVGNLRVGSISDCTNNSSIEGTQYVGGLVGGQVANAANDATITNCTNNSSNNSSVNGTQYVGGIAGNLRVGSISDCTNSGEINSTSTSCGGIVGLVGKDQNTLSTVAITNCINEGNITSVGQGQAGGIAGGVYPNLTCIGCSNYGNITVSGNSGAGGIVGYIQSNNADAVFSIKECYSDGIITTENGWAGGVFGYFSSSSVGTMNLTDVLSASKVVDTSATGRVGGFMVGQNPKTDATTVAFDLKKCQQIASISYSGSNNYSTGYVFGGGY